MSLKGLVGKAVMKRIEAMPSVQAEKERSERIGPTIRAASNAAYSALDDEEAKLVLTERLQADTEVLEEATINLAQTRDDYLRDRAYRLLSAAASSTAVQPIAPERQKLFAEEAALGRMPIELAFEYLAQMEPRLLVAKRLALASDPTTDDRKPALTKRVRESLHGLVGARASEEHKLLNTNLAISIVNHYLEQLAGTPGLGSTGTPYFDSPRKRVVSSVAFGRPNRPAS